MNLKDYIEAAVTLYTPRVDHPTSGQGVQLGIWDGTVGSGTRLQHATCIMAGSYDNSQCLTAITTPTSSSKTYNGAYNSTNGTGAGFNGNGTTAPTVLMVELV